MHAEQEKGSAEATEIQYKETNKGIGILPRDGGIDNQKRKTRVKGEVM